VSCIGRFVIFLHQGKNPLHGATAGSAFIGFQLSCQAVEKTTLATTHFGFFFRRFVPARFADGLRLLGKPNFSSQHGTKCMAMPP